MIHPAGSIGNEREWEGDSLGWELDSGGNDGVGSGGEVYGEFDDASESPELQSRNYYSRIAIKMVFCILKNREKS